MQSGPEANTFVHDAFDGHAAASPAHDFVHTPAMPGLGVVKPLTRSSSESHVKPVGHRVPPIVQNCVQ
jgi:hypothetical protein